MAATALLTPTSSTTSLGTSTGSIDPSRPPPTRVCARSGRPRHRSWWPGALTVTIVLIGLAALSATATTVVATRTGAEVAGVAADGPSSPSVTAFGSSPVLRARPTPIPAPSPVPPPTPAPAPPDVGSCGITDLGACVAAVVNAFFENVVSDALNPLLGLLSDSLLTTPTPDSLPALATLWNQSWQILLACYGLLILIGGIVLMAHGTVQSLYSFKEIAPRVVVGFLAGALSLGIAEQAVELANALSHAVLGDPGSTA